LALQLLNNPANLMGKKALNGKSYPIPWKELVELLGFLAKRKGSWKPWNLNFGIKLNWKKKKKEEINPPNPFPSNS